MSLVDLPFSIVSRLDIGPECWKWLGAHTSARYGSVSLRGKIHGVHAVTYEAEFGPVPSGLVLDHVKERCTLLRPCANPWHLEPVTTRENTLRGDSFSAMKSRQTACIHGHEFTPENTRIRKNGSRNCLTCNRQADSERARRDFSIQNKKASQIWADYARDGRKGSGRRGVHWDPTRDRWRAGIWKGRTIHLGLFADVDEAARAYDIAARRLFGDRAQLNSPDVVDSEQVARMVAGE